MSDSESYVDSHASTESGDSGNVVNRRRQPQRARKAPRFLGDEYVSTKHTASKPGPVSSSRVESETAALMTSSPFHPRVSPVNDNPNGERLDRWLTDVADRLRRQEMELDRCKRELSHRDQELDECKRECKGELSRRDRELDECKRELSRRGQELEERTRESSRRGQELEERTRELSRRGQELEERTRELSRHSQELDECRRVLSCELWEKEKWKLANSEWLAFFNDGVKRLVAVPSNNT
ncbi:hypothetical protein FQN50_002970 [Emmonsiellopsis sp. PD_5]|nr:hypothetical protein FQN50_002970 [Emmonsiellopsis sp. PD_5]